jgi:transcriptional regulator GlxA family with amidase domain
MTGTPIRIAIVGYEGVQTLDIAGPWDAFGAANSARAGAYSTLMTSLDGTAFASESGLRMTPDCAFEDIGLIDTLIIPGGASLRNPRCGAAIAAAVQRRAAQCRRTVSVCTGVYGVAPAGLLDGRRVTTHWRFADDLAARFPALKPDCDKIFIKDGPLRFQARAGDRFADLAVWIASHLDGDLSVEQLAARTGLSERQFDRRFTLAFGRSPSQQIEALRLDAARNSRTIDPGFRTTDPTLKDPHAGFTPLEVLCSAALFTYRRNQRLRECALYRFGCIGRAGVSRVGFHEFWYRHELYRETDDGRDVDVR